MQLANVLLLLLFKGSLEIFEHTISKRLKINFYWVLICMAPPLIKRKVTYVKLVQLHNYVRIVTIAWVSNTCYNTMKRLNVLVALNCI